MGVWCVAVGQDGGVKSASQFLIQRSLSDRSEDGHGGQA